jgi:hypothetical protein
MERVQTLINKLKEQLENTATQQQLLQTTQLLLAELQGLGATGQEGKVSVIMPQSFFQKEIIERIVEEKKQVDAIKEPIVEEKIADVIVEKLSEQPAPILSKPKEIYSLLVNDSDMPPTLALQEKKETFELNDIVTTEKQSFNDLLKEDKKEVAATLTDHPVKDLRKAIGINDKYTYINELFHGDEAMYERSIKTVNGFSVYPEAEQWIKRELFTKLCWENESEIVKQFDQLVRRRFS